jgi:hypothetical protein
MEDLVGHAKLSTDGAVLVEILEDADARSEAAELEKTLSGLHWLLHSTSIETSHSE